MSISNFYEYGPEAKDVDQLIFLLHGVGSNGQDLISLAPHLAQGLPNAMFISPDAPFVCDMVPAGYPNAFQWFSLENRDPHAMLSGVKTVFPLVEEFIMAQAERFNVPLSKVVMLGFSQGTMTSLYCAPRLKDKIAGVMGYSGALLWDADADNDAAHKMPICLVHGEADDVVPVAAYHLGRKTLLAHGYDVSGHTSAGLTHSIDHDGINAGSEFLKQVLSTE